MVKKQIGAKSSNITHNILVSRKYDSKVGEKTPIIYVKPPFEFSEGDFYKVMHASQQRSTITDHFSILNIDRL